MSIFHHHLGATNLKMYLLYKEMARLFQCHVRFIPSSYRASPRSRRELLRNDEIRDVCSSSKVFKVSLTRRDDIKASPNSRSREVFFGGFSWHKKSWQLIVFLFFLGWWIVFLFLRIRFGGPYYRMVIQ